MPSRKNGILSEFLQSVHYITSTQTFVEQFQCLCQKWDRHGMIKVLLDIEEVEKLRVQESYHEKNDEEAERIYGKYRTLAKTDNNHGLFVQSSFLTKAFFAATPRSSIFKEILLERAKCWYSANLFTRCLKDCDYLIYILSEKANELVTCNPLHDNEINVKCAELRSKCIETLERADEAPRKALNSIVTLPHIQGKSNSKMPSCSDSVTQCYDRIRGRHLVSTRNVEAGSVLLIDQPFSFSTDIQSLSTNCLHCHISLKLEISIQIPCHSCQTVSYCSNRCRQESWQKYHRYECKIFDYFYESNDRGVDLTRQHRSHLLLAWRTTIESAIEKTRECIRDNWLSYQESLSNEDKNNRETDWSIDPYDSLCYQTVFALETHCSNSSMIINLSRSLRSIFFAKCFELVFLQNHPSSEASIGTKKLLLVAVGMLRHMQSVDCNAYEIVENVRDETTRIWGPRNVGGAIYPTVSLINHSCYPNVVRHSYPHGKVVVRALRYIEKGAEILDCYGPHFVSDTAPCRRRYLQDKYHFTCNCEACVNDFQLPSVVIESYKCLKCNSPVNQKFHKCAKCNTSANIKKMQIQLAKSVKKREAAIAKMFNGNYLDALPSLLEHAALVQRLVAEPSLEAIKTQQSIVQCYNSFSCIAPSI